MIIYKYYLLDFFYGNKKKRSDFFVLKRVQVYINKLAKVASFSYGFTSQMCQWLSRRTDVELLNTCFSDEATFSLGIAIVDQTCLIRPFPPGSNRQSV